LQNVIIFIHHIKRQQNTTGVTKKTKDKLLEQQSYTHDNDQQSQAVGLLYNSDLISSLSQSTYTAGYQTVLAWLETLFSFCCIMASDRATTHAVKVRQRRQAIIDYVIGCRGTKFSN